MSFRICDSTAEGVEWAGNNLSWEGVSEECEKEQFAGSATVKIVCITAAFKVILPCFLLACYIYTL